MRPQIGDIIEDQYCLEQLLGSGGMAEVFLAIHVEERYQYALKFIREEYLDDQSLIERFQNEAITLRKLAHPNMVQFYGFSARLPDYAYIVMQYIPSNALNRILRQYGKPGERRPPLELTLHILVQTAIALKHIHRAGYIHRDVKTGNILIRDSDKQVFLADLGIAKNFQTSSHMTQGLIGTPAYMAPEQHQFRPLTQATDVYALGVIAFEMLVGHLPFLGQPDNVSIVSLARSSHDTRKHRIIEQHLTEEPPDASALNPHLPVQVDQVLHRVMAKDLEERYDDALIFVRDLHAALKPILPAALLDFDTIGRDATQLRTSGVPAESKPRTVPPPSTSPHPPAHADRRPRWITGAVMLGVLAIVAVILAMSMSGNRDDDQTEAALAPTNTVTSTHTQEPTATQTLPPTVTTQVELPGKSQQPTETRFFTLGPPSSPTPTATMTATATATVTATPTVTDPPTLAPKEGAPLPSTTQIPPSSTPTATPTPTFTATYTPTATPTPLPDMRTILAGFEQSGTMPSHFNCQLFATTYEALTMQIEQGTTDPAFAIGADLIAQSDAPIRRIYEEHCADYSAETDSSLPSDLWDTFIAMGTDLKRARSALDTPN